MSPVRFAALAATAIFGCASVASAADMPVKALPIAAVYNWTGFYVGGNVGGQWGSDNDPAIVNPNSYFGTASNLAAANNALPMNLKPSGITGGLQMGYNWQMLNYVVGVEADISALSGNAQRNLTTLFPGFATGLTLSDSSREKWFSSLRVRGGYAVDRALFYATGGVAFANWSISHSYSDTAGPIPLTTVTPSSTRTGWAVGAGVEYAVTTNWTVRGEYLYADFGTVSSTLNIPPPAAAPTAIVYNDRLKQNIARLGVNYKFGP